MQFNIIYFYIILDTRIHKNYNFIEEQGSELT